MSVLEALADELSTADYVLHDPSLPGGSLTGEAAGKQWLRDALKNMPDIQVTAEDMIAEGDRVASRLTLRATNAATGKPVNLLGMAISRFAGGKIVEAWQLGVPAEAQPSRNRVDREPLGWAAAQSQRLPRSDRGHASIINHTSKGEQHA